MADDVMDQIVVWKDRDNLNFIQLSKNKVVLTTEEMALITKVELYFKGTYYNSDDYPDSFDWSTYADEGKVAVKLGLLPLPIDSDQTELIIYDAVNIAGILWEQIAIRVRGDAAV